MYIHLDREREVRLRNKAISQIEKRFKKSYIKIIQDIGNLTVDEQIFILYAGLKHEDSTLTLEIVENLVDEYSDLGELMQAITDASFEAYGTTQEEAEEKAQQLMDPKTATVE